MSSEPLPENDEEISPVGAGADGADALPEVSAETDKIISDEPEGTGKEGFFAKLNPMRMFRINNADNFVRQGRELLENGSLSQATVSFKKALAADPNNVGAYRGLGKVFFKKGGRSNLETALNYYSEGIKRSPLDHDLYAITAKIYDSLGKRKEATLERKKFVIVRALDADPGNAIANNNMGILTLQQGKPKEALDYFHKALRTDKNYDVAHRNIAAVYHRMAKDQQDLGKRKDLLSQARDAINKAMKIAESFPTLLAHARMLLMNGEYEEVLRVCEKADVMEAANKNVYFLKKMALEGLGRFEEAKDAEESYQIFAAADSAPPADEE